MDLRKEFVVKPGTKVKLSDFDPGYTGKTASEKEAAQDTQKYLEKLRTLQYLLYAEKKRSLLIVLQGLDAAGKDGTVTHVMSAMNPQGTTVTGFKRPTVEGLDHDFLWRVHPHAPVRVPWPSSTAHTTRMCWWCGCTSWRRKNRNWKISDSDYKERQYWDAYTEAFEEVFQRTSKIDAPGYVIPANHKWFRNLAVSQILAATMEDFGMQVPKPEVDLEVIRKEYQQAAAEEGKKQQQDVAKKSKASKK